VITRQPWEFEAISVTADLSGIFIIGRDNLDRKTARLSRAHIGRIAREQGSAGEAALAGLLFIARTLKEEELLTASEVDALFAVLTAKLPEDRHDEVRSVLLPN